MQPRAPRTTRFLAGAADATHVPRLHQAEVAFAGRSNVGKSSLLNRLAGQRKLARVSKTPGRTQAINFFLVDEWLVVADLPGYGFARVPAAVQHRWQQLIETYLRGRRNLRAVVVIVDLRRGVEADDAMLLDFLAALGIPAILVATKADKLAYGQRQHRARLLAEAVGQPLAAVLTCSARTGEGMAQLWAELKRHCGE